MGVGWVVWRETKDLPEGLIFHVNYLGGDLPTFALNFSRPAGQVICQYYNLLRLGKEGYQRIHGDCYKTAQMLAEGLQMIGPFEMIHSGKEPVSYTHLDVYKRQGLGFDDSPPIPPLL